MFAGSRLLLPDLRTVLHWCRNPGGRRDMLSEEALAAEGDRGAEEVRQHGEAETASGCPRRWCWSDRRSGGTEGSLPCSGVKEGWLPSERERRSRRRSPGGRSLLPSAMLGEEQGTGTRCRLPSNQRSHRRPPGGGASSHPPKDVQYHRMAPQVRASQLVEDRAAVCRGTGPRNFFFIFLSPLSRLCLSSSFHLVFSRLVCPYPQVRHGRRDRLPPQRGGRGGVERSLGSTPWPARGDGGM